MCNLHPVALISSPQKHYPLYALKVIVSGTRNVLNVITCNLSSNDRHPLWGLSLPPARKRERPYDAWSNRTWLRTEQCCLFSPFILPKNWKHADLQVAKGWLVVLGFMAQEPDLAILRQTDGDNRTPSSKGNCWILIH
ncbi:hypothetical protein AVEN_44361-1 [Araneus ventricosus]|uniref:Uncharacterized protein n=1 Tax=Araneus ventricosus TaxID=182803 RepID=A0A4Y2GXD0_ARAVE|nr:hypothetical protein AVEN_44361-1 [Araneus ventricosus]